MILSDLKIMFHNCNGLDLSKLNTYKDYISLISYDIIIIQEHWFVRTLQWQSDSFVALVSIPPDNIQSRRADGGLAILIHPSKQHLFKTILSTKHSLIFSYNNIVISTSYFPPESMTTDDIRNELNHLVKPHIYVGDFNYRTGPTNNDTTITKAARRDLIYEHCTRWQIYWKKPIYADRSSRSSRSDHCFHCLNMDSTIKVLPRDNINLRSDHHAISMEFQYDSQTLESMHNNPNMLRENIQTRIYIRRLNRDEETRQRYIKRVESKINSVDLQQRMDAFFASCFCETMTRKHLRSMLDQFNDEIVYIIWESGKEVLGHYEVNKAKQSIDNLMYQLNEVNSNSEATMIFKRMNRGNHVRIQASRPNVDVNEEAYTFFSELWHEDNPSELADLESNQAPFLLKNFNVTPLDPDTMSTPFSTALIKDTIRSYPNSKSAGLDTIHVLLLKPLLISQTFMNILSSFYSMCQDLGLTPPSWNHGRTTLIAKKQQEPTVNSTRPISITSMLRRIFECCLLKTWETSNESFMKLHPLQGGSRKGYSSFSYAVLNHELSHTKRSWTILLDIKKGFDSVRHVDILRTLINRKTSRNPLSLIHSLFIDELETYLVVNGNQTPPISVTRGIFQGSVLSPLLFEIWIDELCELLHSFHDDDELPIALFYVDDIVLKGKSRREVQEYLDICEMWLTSRCAKFNPDKSYLLKPKETLIDELEDHPILLYDKPLKVVSEEEYLGVVVSSKGAKWNKVLRKQIDQAQKMLNYFKRVGVGWPEWVRLIVTKTFCLSKFNYCAPCTSLWLELNDTSAEAHELKQLLNSFDEDILKFIFQTTLNQSSNVMRCMAQLDTIESQLQTMKHLAIGQIQRLSLNHPWHTMKAWSRNLSVLRTDYYLPRLHHSSDAVREYNRVNSTLPPSEQTSMKIWFKKAKYSKLMYEMDGILQRYVLVQSRKKLWLPDGILFVKDLSQRRMFIDWRRNLLFSKRQCLVCHESFNRRHLRDCEYQTITPSGYFDDVIHGTWISECELLEAEKVKHKKNTDPALNYCYIDSLLNNFKYDLAYLWLTWLDGNLPSRTRLLTGT